MSKKHIKIMKKITGKGRVVNLPGLRIIIHLRITREDYLRRIVMEKI